MSFPPLGYFTVGYRGEQPRATLSSGWECLSFGFGRGGEVAEYFELCFPGVDQVESLLRKRDVLIQTLDYRAPEVYHLVSAVGKPMDVWSVGILLCELLS